MAKETMLKDGKAYKKIDKTIISIDAGFDAFKVTMISNDKFNYFSLPAQILNVSGDEKEILPSKEDEEDKTIYCLENAIGSTFRYVIGSKASSLLVGDEKYERQISESKDPFYKQTMERFSSPIFKKVLMATFFKAIAIAKENDTDLTKKIYVGISVPYDGFYSNSFKASLEEFFQAGSVDNLSFNDKINGEYKALDVNMDNVEVSTNAQVTSAMFSEYLDSNGEDIEVNNKYIDDALPLTIIDAGYKTVGINPISSAFKIQDCACSNTNFAMKNINSKVAKELNEIEGITAYFTDATVKAYLNANKTAYAMTDEGRKAIDIKQKQDVELETTANSLFDYLITDKNLKRAVIETNTFLVCGGTGKGYYDKLKKCFDDKNIDSDIFLAKAEFRGLELGSVYAPSIGALKMLIMD